MRDLSALDRLAYIGRRGMGALEFVPPTAEELETPFKVEIADLYQLARQAFEEAGRFNVPVSGNPMVESLFKVGTSAGGRRYQGSGQRQFRGGTMLLRTGGDPLSGLHADDRQVRRTPEDADDTDRIQLLPMAVDAELQMMPSRLLEGEQTAHFDRAFRPPERQEGAYPDIGCHEPLGGFLRSTVRGSLPYRRAAGELRQLFRSMVLNVLGGNVDDHNKNFSFRWTTTGIGTLLQYMTTRSRSIRTHRITSTAIA